MAQMENPHAGALRNSIQSPATAKQHSFRKTMNLPHDAQQAQHLLVLIESAPTERVNMEARGKGEVTLKAVKLSNIVTG